MSKENWVYALNEDDIEEGDKKALLLQKEKVALIKKNGNLYAMSNKCVHMECPLTRGTLDDFIIICPCHDWRFDIRTGEFLDAKELKIPIFKVKVSNNEIYVNLGGELT